MPFTKASHLSELSINWLWPGRLALGKPALFDGDPELGKSLVALDLCAAVTAGRPFPDGQPGPAPSNVIILNSEDNPRDTIIPRLRSRGADLDRAFIFHQDVPLDLL